MKRIILVVLAVLLFASVALAGGSGDVDFKAKLENTTEVNTSTASSAAAAAAASANQKQAQSSVNNNANSATVGDVNVGGQNTSINIEDKREHIVVQPGTNGNFVGAPTAGLEGWKPFVCQPLFSVYTKERLENTETAGSASDRKGGFFHRHFSSPIKSVVHVPFGGTSDDKPITLINWEPSGNVIYPTDELLGEFECEGYYGWPRGAALGRCLAEAKAKTNTSRVFAYYRVRKDPKNSGMSIGSGGGVSILGGPGGDKIAGAMSLGGLIGTTSAYVDEAYDWTVLALNDGPTNPPPGIYVCGQQPPAPTPPIVVEKKPEPKPCCDAEKIREEIRKVEKEIKECKFWSRNNLDKRALAAYLYEHLYNCTGKTDKSLLDKSLFHAKKAQQNYDEVHTHPKSRVVSRADWDEQHAISVLKIVYWNEAAAIRELSGRKAEIDYAREKGFERMPASTDEIQEVSK